jgi:hypothetical protein
MSREELVRNGRHPDFDLPHQQNRCRLTAYRPDYACRLRGCADSGFAG